MIKTTVLVDNKYGLDTFFNSNDHAKLYVAGGCAENCYDRHGLRFKYAGVPKGILSRGLPWKRILAIIGGFHLFNKSDDFVRQFAKRVGDAGAEAVYTGHCTGDKAMSILKTELGSKVHELKTGLVFEIPLTE